MSEIESTAAELLDTYDTLMGRKLRLEGKFKFLRKIIMDLSPIISIDDIGVMQDGSTVFPRIKPEIVDHAITIEERARELLTVQDDLTRTNRELVKARDEYYQKSGILL